MNKLLSLENVEYNGDPLSRLRGVSFSLNLGENVVFFGLENSGIDHLFPLITYVVKEFTGIIRFKDRIINKMDAVELYQTRRDLVYIQSSYGLIGNMSVEDNISLPLTYHSKMNNTEINSRVTQLIQDLDLEYFRHLMPTNLRYSQSLATAYARATAMDPDLLLMEHPLENQSLMNVLPFMSLLKKRCLAPDKSVVMITYKPKYFLDFIDRFIMLHDGRVVFDGNGDALMSRENPYVKQYLTNSLEGPMVIL